MREANLQIFKAPGTRAVPLIEPDDDYGGVCDSSSENSSADENAELPDTGKGVNHII